MFNFSYPTSISTYLFTLMLGVATFEGGVTIGGSERVENPIALSCLPPQKPLAAISSLYFRIFVLSLYIFCPTNSVYLEALEAVCAFHVSMVYY